MIIDLVVNHTSDEHVWPDVENVTERNQRYWVVEKLGEAARVSGELDPRSNPAT